MRTTKWPVAGLIALVLAAYAVSAQTPPLPDTGRQIPLPDLTGNNRQQSGFIACPSQSVTIGAPDSSATGWSKPKQTAMLVDTAVMLVGGRKTLACIYRVTANQRDPAVAGEFSILRELPSGVSGCVVAQGGFKCS